MPICGPQILTKTQFFFSWGYHVHFLEKKIICENYVEITQKYGTLFEKLKKNFIAIF